MDSIVTKYLNGKTCNDIACLLRVSRNKIALHLKQKGVKIRGKRGYRKYQFNQGYFTEILNEHQAYWLGWMFADGYNNQDANTIKFQIQSKDKEILTAFKNDIQYNGPIRDYENLQSLICLTSQRLSEDLFRHGCHQNKSLTLKWPKLLPEHLVRHFIRGYFDGDGCISGNKNNFQFTVIGTKWFCKQLNQYLSPIVGKKKLENHPNNSITKRYRVGGRNQIRKIFDYLYLSNSICLTRKKQKMEELLCIS